LGVSASGRRPWVKAHPLARPAIPVA
jgi:hypothetical protein